MAVKQLLLCLSCRLVDYESTISVDFSLFSAVFTAEQTTELLSVLVSECHLLY